MPRPIWSGTINFGLVSIPVSLVSAEEHSKTVDFDMVDKRDHAPIGYKRINKNTGREIDNKDIIKGIKTDKGEYVFFTDDEIKDLRVKGNGGLEIESFVDRDEISWLYFEKPYFLLPKKKDFKTYELLREALERSKKYGVARIVIHNKQHLAFIAPKDDGLVLELLRFPHELRDPSDYEFPATSKKVKLSEKEVKLAEQLIDQMSEAWDPKKFHDTYFDDVMEQVNKKVRTGKTDSVSDAKKEDSTKSGKIIRLAPLLEASLKRRKKKAS